VDLTPGDPFDDLVLAVYEAVANTVDHAYRHAPEPGAVRIVARRFNDAIHVTITDHGDWRDNHDTAHTSRPFRGRGLPLIRALIPHVHLERGPAGTAVHLRAPLPPPSTRGPNRE
jgi:serine/threonine-protein kinase RsbW